VALKALEVAAPTDDWAASEPVGVVEINTVNESEKINTDQQEVTNGGDSMVIDAPHTTAAAISDIDMSNSDDDDLYEQQSVDDILLKNLLSRKTSLERSVLPKNRFLKELLEGHYKRRKLNLQPVYNTNTTPQGKVKQPMNIVSLSKQGFEMGVQAQNKTVLDHQQVRDLNIAAKGQDPNKETPMNFFLQGQAAKHQHNRSASILSECVMMFWFGYFCRKQLQ
jgi:hypothetical protein